MQQATYKNPPKLRFLAILAAATSVVLVFTITPWNIAPTLVTEEVTVIAVTEHGCVGESIFGHSVVIPNCDANVGDIVTAIFHIPAMELNGFYDRIQEKLEMI